MLGNMIKPFQVIQTNVQLLIYCTVLCTSIILLTDITIVYRNPQRHTPTRNSCKITCPTKPGDIALIKSRLNKHTLK